MIIGKKRKRYFKLNWIVLVCLIAWLFDPDKLSKKEGIMKNFAGSTFDLGSNC